MQNAKNLPFTLLMRRSCNNLDSQILEEYLNNLLPVPPVSLVD
jgi:hypothetical protein